MNWLRSIARKFSGAEAREREETAQAILAEHEARDDFGHAEARERLRELLGEAEGDARFAAHVRGRLAFAIAGALTDGLLTPEEEAAILDVRRRYGSPRVDPELQHQLDQAKRQYAAWDQPLVPVQTPLMLRKGEWCAHAVEATAIEERQRTVRVDYHGPTARLRIAKGVYYRAGSISPNRVSESYHHAFGSGVLGATNLRLLWVSPAKSISIPLGKIVLFEPYTDGIKVIRDTGKPLIFQFPAPDPASMVLVCRVIEELRG